MYVCVGVWVCVGVGGKVAWSTLHASCHVIWIWLAILLHPQSHDVQPSFIDHTPYIAVFIVDKLLSLRTYEFT